MRFRAILKMAAVTMAAAVMMTVAMIGFPVGANAQAKDTVLKQADMEKLMPASVFYGNDATEELGGRKVCRRQLPADDTGGH